MGMTEVGRQDGQTALGILSRLVPAYERSRRKHVPLIPHAELEALFRVPDYSAYRSPGAAIPGEYAAKGTANTE
jgi:hypothetical protein